MKKIVVLTSGGDAPGMNAAIRAAVRTGKHFGLEVYGCPFGFQGLVDQQLIPMTPEKVANCIQQGGTILKTGRCQAFFDQETRAEARRFLAAEGIEGLIVIGGDGSFRGASILAKEGPAELAVIGIPGTIDNDIPGTDYTIGFDTARNTALQAIDKIRDTASSHQHHFLIEVMGRSSSFLAVDVGIAGGAEIILVPESNLTLEQIAKKLLQRRSSKLSSIIVVAEADQPGRSVNLAAELQALTQMPFRVCILGHTQRGGSPTTLDRKVASSMGYLAVKALLEGKSQLMVSLQEDSYTLQPFPAENASPRRFKSQELLEINDILCA